MRTAILLAAYGAGTARGREGALDFEKQCRARFPSMPLRWAYTSPRIRERIALERRKSDSVPKALMRLHYEKYEACAVQPLQAIPGGEYEDVLYGCEGVARETGLKISVGRPLLSGEGGLEATALALLRSLPPERGAAENVIFMGHGARRPAVSLYDRLADALAALDKGIFLGTLSGGRSLEKILPLLVSKRVWLVPLLSLAGGHVLRDMAGDHESSWKSIISAQNHECLPVLKGLSQCPGVSGIWLDNLSLALAALQS